MGSSARGGVASRWTLGFVALVATCGSTLSDARAAAVPVLTMTTQITDMSTGQPWTGTEVTGASEYDAATLTWSGSTPTGNVEYDFYYDGSGSCTGNQVVVDPEIVQPDGTVHHSYDAQNLGAGTYAYVVTYSGDSNYGAYQVPCTTFTVKQSTGATVATVVQDASNGSAWSNTEVTGAQAYDTATVSGVSGVTPTGTVTFELYGNGQCTGSPIPTTASTGSLNSGSVSGGLTAALASGSYGFLATYSGDNNYAAAAGSCEPFTVGAADNAIGAVVYDASTLQPWTNGETTGASAYDVASIPADQGIEPTGSVVYEFFQGGGCAGSPSSTETVTVSSGTVPASSPTSALLAGTYSYLAEYGGDSNYDAATTCTSFVVNANPLTIDPSTTSAGPGQVITFDAKGGTGTGYSFAFATPGGNNSSASLQSAGASSATYTAGTAGGSSGATDTIVVTDSLGETATATVAVGPTIALAAQSSTTVPPRGSVSFVASGGYVGTSGCTTYSWSVSGTSGAGAPTTSGANASDATYTAGANGPAQDTVTVTDCANNSAQVTVQVIAPVTIAAATTSGTAASSTYPGGTLVLTASGGSGTFTSWSFASTSSGSPSLSASSGDPVNYVAGCTGGGQGDVVQVTDSLGNTGSITLSVGAGVAISTPGGTSTPPMGSLSLSASGGSGSYSWSVNPNNSGSPGVSPTTSTSGASVTYKAGSTGNKTDTVIATDANSKCSAPSVNISVGGGITINSSTLTTPPRGSIAFSASGGSKTGYQWKITTNGSGGSIDQNTGLYVAGSKGSTSDVVQVTDSLMNTASVTVTVTAGVSITPPSATVAPLGRVSFSASGGSGTGFSWSLSTNSSGGNIVGGAYQAGGAGGTVDTVKVVDSLGNVATASVHVTPALWVLPASPSTPPRGTIAFDAMGGQQPYHWTLQSNGSGGSVNASTGMYLAGATGNTTDTVRVTDTNGASLSIVVTVTAGVSISPLNASTAPGGSIDFTAMGGSGQGYMWALTTNRSGGMIDPSSGRYVAGMTPKVDDVVTVTDSLGNVASASISVGGGVSITPFDPTVPPRGSQVFTATGGSGSGYTWKLSANASGGTVNAATGDYTAGPAGNRTDILEVTDSLGNVGSTSITVGAGVAVSPAATTAAPLGTVHFAASGGSGNGYTYSLATNGSAASIGATTGVYKAGPIGNATDVVLVTDSLGNTATATVSVTGALAISPTSASVAPRGSATFKASGGSGTYVFSLQTNGSGGSVSPQGAYTAGSTPNVVDVVAVADSNGATLTAAVRVGAGVTIKPLTPSVAPGGMVQFAAMGGSGTGFVWTMTSNQSGGGISVGGAYTAGSTGKTVDTVKVTDSLGNSATTSVSVGGGLAIDPVVASTPPLGKLSFSAVGGSGGYSFAIATNASGGGIDKSTGAYVAGNKGSVVDVVTVTDSAGMTASADIAVGPGVTVTPATAAVMAGATIPFSVSGGSGMSYAWSILPNQSGGSIDPMTGAYVAGTLSGTDTVVATDSLGNVGTAAVTVKGSGMPGGDAGAEGGTMDSGMPMDGGKGMDGSAGRDGSMPSGDAGPSGDSGNEDSGFEVDGSNFDAGPGGSVGGGSCGCAVVGFDGAGSSGALALGGLALAIAAITRRDRRRRSRRDARHDD